MTTIASTKNSWSAPSIGQMLNAIPKIMAGLAVVLSGISNARGTVLGSPGQHGGGLQTEANDRWQRHWQPKMRACLSESWVRHFDPDRSIVECTLRSIARWEKNSGDVEAAEVVSRGMDHYQPRPRAANEPAPGRGGMQDLVEATHAIMRGTDAYARVMEKAETLLWFYSSAFMDDLGAPGHHYSARSLRRLLKEAIGLESFMREACPLSDQLHELALEAGEEINRLMPELMRTQARREAFASRIDKDFVASDASMNNRRVNFLLQLLANHMTTRNSQMLN
jgi:hypothetical protein